MAGLGVAESRRRSGRQELLRHQAGTPSTCLPAACPQPLNQAPMWRWAKRGPAHPVQVFQALQAPHVGRLHVGHAKVAVQGGGELQRLRGRRGGEHTGQSEERSRSGDKQGRGLRGTSSAWELGKKRDPEQAAR